MDFNYFDPKCGLIEVKKEPFLHPKCMCTITGRAKLQHCPWDEGEGSCVL